MLLVTVRPPAENPAEARWQSIMEEIAVASRGAYQSLLSDSDDFMEYFRAATPIDVIERIGSRSERAEHVSESPGSRARRRGYSRGRRAAVCLPSWYGVATGLKKAIDAHGEDVLVEMFEQWHFFRVLLSDVATALAKADLDVAARVFAARRRAAREVFSRDSARVQELRRPDPAADAPERVARSVAHAAARDSLAQPVRRSDELLAGRPARALARAAGARTAPILQALTASINGIAHAMQGTG